MESITIGQIVGAIGIITVIGSFIGGIIVAVSKWWKSRVTNKFTDIDNRFEVLEKDVNNKFKEVDNRLDYVEIKRDEYEAELENSKRERKLLMGGLLSALKGLGKMGCDDTVTKSISEIEEYMMDKTHD